MIPAWIASLLSKHALSLALLLALGGALGWGWVRGQEIKGLKGDIAKVEGQLETARADAKTLRASLAAQNDAIDAMKAAAYEREKAAKAAIQAAQKAGAGRQARAATIMATTRPAGDECTLAQAASRDFDDELRAERMMTK